MPRWKRARISSLTFSRPSRRRCRDDLPPRNQTASAASATVRISGDRHPGWRGGTHRVREAGGGPGRRSHGFHRLGGGRRRQRPASAALLQGRLRRPQPLMRTVDHVRVLAPFPRVFAAASTVARWPSILPHYRWVRVLDDGLVEMAAWRPFGGGLLKYPTWWVSEMTVDRPAGEIRYRHVRGISRGMEVVWRLVEDGEGPEGGVEVEIGHTWRGRTWLIIGRLAANLVIGPIFIHGITSRTLSGLKRAAEGVSRRVSVGSSSPGSAPSRL